LQFYEKRNFSGVYNFSPLPGNIYMPILHNYEMSAAGRLFTVVFLQTKKSGIKDAALYSRDTQLTRN